jgi:hypothetical protein
MIPLTSTRRPNPARLRRPSTGAGDARLKAASVPDLAGQPDRCAASGFLASALHPYLRPPHASKLGQQSAPSHNHQRHYPHRARHHRANLSRGFLP